MVIHSPIYLTTGMLCDGLRSDGQVGVRNEMTSDIIVSVSQTDVQYPSTDQYHLWIVDPSEVWVTPHVNSTSTIFSLALVCFV